MIVPTMAVRANISMHNTIILYNTQQRLEKIMQITMNLPTIRENYMQNAAETRKLYAKYNNYTQKFKFYNTTQNTNFIKF